MMSEDGYTYPTAGVAVDEDETIKALVQLLKNLTSAQASDPRIVVFGDSCFYLHEFYEEENDDEYVDLCTTGRALYPKQFVFLFSMTAEDGEEQKAKHFELSMFCEDVNLSAPAFAVAFKFFQSLTGMTELTMCSTQAEDYEAFPVQGSKLLEFVTNCGKRQEPLHIKFESFSFSRDLADILWKPGCRSPLYFKHCGWGDKGASLGSSAYKYTGERYIKVTFVETCPPLEQVHQAMFDMKQTMLGTKEFRSALLYVGLMDLQLNATEFGVLLSICKKAETLGWKLLSSPPVGLDDLTGGAILVEDVTAPGKKSAAVFKACREAWQVEE